MASISVIVPVYKVAPYLRRCVDSILAQTFTDFELILVDDGSPDNCGAICDEYAAKDSRIKVIHKANRGAGAARNGGLEIAQGEWILFCDSDDCYNGDVLSGFFRSVDLECHHTLYCFNFYDVWPDGIEKKLKYPKADISLSACSDRISCLSSSLSHKTMGYAVWDKLYSKKVIDQYHIRFLERNTMSNRDDWADDLAFNLQYLLCTDHILVSELPVYLLSKHGTPSEQNENGLVGRLDHMLKIFSVIQDTPAYKQSPEITEDFWKIVIWHLRRYLYLDARSKGADVLRQECINSPYSIQLMGWIKAALLHWNDIEGNWNDVEGADYRILLQYLRNGNMFIYKLRNYWLWKIRPAIQKIMRRKT